MTHDIPGVWLEASRSEKISFPGKYRQAQKASKGKVPIVIHRYNRDSWKVYTDLDYLISLWQIVNVYTSKESE